MEGIVVNYRRGRRTVKGNQLIIEVSGFNSRERASSLVGKRVIVPVGKSQVVGIITAPHGNSGRVRARFENGLPGQVVGKRVEIVG